MTGSVLVTALAGAVLCAEAGQRGPLELLDRYQRAEHQAVATLLAGTRDFGALRHGFEDSAERWIDSGPPEDLSRRKLIAAGVAIEIAAAAVERDWLAARPLIEWGCALWRRSPPTGAERLWHLAAIAIAGRARDTRLLLGNDGPELAFDPTQTRPIPALGNPVAPYGWVNFDHLTHAERRFEDEARFRLARAFAHEPALEDVPPRDRAWHSNDLVVSSLVSRWADSIRRYQPLLEDIDVGAEAELRTGSLLLRLRDYGNAIAHFQRADARGGDAFVHYLARFFAGEVNEAVGRHDRAQAAYHAALDVVPTAQSGIVRLSALLFLDGQPRAASALVAASLNGASRPDDPWRLYSYGDFRMLPELLAELREELR